MYCKECGDEIENGEICKVCKWKLEVKQDNSFTKRPYYRGISN